MTTLLAAGVVRVRGEPFRNTAKFAIAFTAAAFLLELLALLHPNMPIGDTLFHAHRFQDVLGGRYYFTSIAPGNYQFPYAPGLYVFAIPFAGLVRRGRGRHDGAADDRLRRRRAGGAPALRHGRARARQIVWLERSRSRCTISSPSASVSWWSATTRMPSPSRSRSPLWRSWPRRPFAWSTGPLSWVSRPFSRRHSCRTPARLRSGRWRRASSRFSSGGAAGRRLRSPAVAVLLASVAAVVVAVVVYYAHFIDTYRTELARIGGETAAAAPDAGGRGIGDRLGLRSALPPPVLRRPGARPRRLGCGDPLGARRARSHDARHDGMAADLRPVSRARHPHTGRHAVLPGRGSRAGDLCGRREQHRLDIGRPVAPRRSRAARWNGFRRSPRVVEYAWGSLTIQGFKVAEFNRHNDLHRTYQPGHRQRHAGQGRPCASARCGWPRPL